MIERAVSVFPAEQKYKDRLEKVSFSALQTITGINQKQLAHYASGVSKPRQAQADKIAKGLHKLAEELKVITA